MYERIRALREDRDLSQKQLSQALHCSQQVYSNYELGQRDIPTAILIALADFYGTSTDYIVAEHAKCNFAVSRQSVKILYKPAYTLVLFAFLTNCIFARKM